MWQYSGSGGASPLASVLHLTLRVTASRVLPVWLFGILAASRLGRLQRALAEGALGTATAQGAYGLACYEGLSALFLGIMAVLFLVRKEPVHKLPGVAPQVVALVGTFLLSALSYQEMTLAYWWVTLPASLLLSAGLAGAVVSVLTLGRCFGITPAARGLVTSGPYRYVRHPLYACEFVASVGLLLPVLSPLSLVLYGTYVALTALRARYEEKVLLAAFPGYAAYRRATRRFVPGVC